MKTFLRSVPYLIWIFLLIVGVVLGPTSSVALAVDKSWNNPNGGDFDVAANWSPTGVPTAQDRVFVTLPGTYTVTLAQGDVFYTLDSLVIGGTTGNQTLRVPEEATKYYRKLNVNTSAVVGSHGILDLNAASKFDGSFRMEGVLNLGSSALLDGTSEKEISTSGVANVTGSFILSSTMRNHGTINVKGSIQSGTLVNDSNGLIEINSGNSIIFDSVNFINSSNSVLDYNGTGGFSSSGKFVNNGIVNVRQSVFTASGSGNDNPLSGTFNVSSGATLRLRGSYTVGMPVFSGSGDVQIAGTLSADSSWTLVPGVTWDFLPDGAFRGSGSKNIAKGALVNISNKVQGYSSFYFDEGPINNSGTVVMDGGNVQGGANAVFNNQKGGYVDVKGNYNSFSSPYNAKFYNKEGATLIFESPQYGAIFNGFSLGNAGLMVIKKGKVSATKYEQTFTGSLQTWLSRSGTAAGYQNQQLNITGQDPVSLAGTLEPIEINGGYQVSIGDQFQILTYPSHLSAFSIPDTRFQATYNASDLTITKVQGTPNDPPAAPTLIAPINNTSLSSLLSFQVSSTDTDATQKLKFKIELLQNNQVVQTLQTTNNWDKASYDSGETATYTAEHLVPGTYQWRAQAFDGVLWGPISSLSTFTFAMDGDLPLNTPTEFTFGTQQVLRTTVTVSQANDFWLTVQKKENLWNCTARLLLNGTEVGSGTSRDDLLLHLTNPQMGNYTLEITASDSGALVVRAGTSLPTIQVGKQFVGTIYHNDGNDWTQVDVPDGVSELNLTGETVGNISTLDVWKDSLSGNPQWSATQTFNPPIKLVISKPSAGRYYLRMHDHGDLSSSGTQVRQYSLIPTAVGISPPVVSGITPNRGGNSGVVTFTLSGSNLDPGATVKLVKGGVTGVVATSVSGGSSQGKLSGQFDLQGVATGLYDVVVDTPNDKTVTFAKAFTVEEGGGGGLWVNVVGRDQIRAGRPSTYTIQFGNNGNTDVFGVPLWVTGIPDDATIKLNFPLMNIPSDPDAESLDTSQIPIDLPTEEGRSIPLMLPIVPAGHTGQVEFTLTVPKNEPVQLHTVVNRPMFRQVMSAYHPQVSETEYTGDDAKCWQSFGEEAMNILELFTGPLDEVLSKKSEMIYKGIQDNLTETAKRQYGYDQEAGEKAERHEAVVSATQLAGEHIPRLAKLLKVKIPGIDRIASAVKIAIGAYQVTYNCAGTAITAYQNLKAVKVVSASDPNEKSGSSGFGPTHYVPGDKPLSYAIYFENKPDASAAAQEVVVTDQLDPSIVDLKTFELGTINFGKYSLTPSQGSSSYTGFVDLRPATNVIVRVDAGLDPKGLITWHFQTIDPATGELTADPVIGFLPPNVDAPEGEGGVSFSIKPLENSTDITVTNKARIIFDGNDPIDTNTWPNQLDFNPPQSQVTALPATSDSKEIAVSWLGTDVGSGVADYSVYVSKNGEVAESWLTGVTRTSAKFFGEVGQTYAFYSVARDNAGNVEATPSTPDTQTYVLGDLSLSVEPTVSVNEGNSGNTALSFKVTLSQASSQMVEVKYAASDITAVAGSDYTATSGTLQFAPGVTVQTITIFVKGDALNEADEQLALVLSAPVNALLKASTATGIIKNDDALPILKVADVKVTEGNNGTTNATFTATLSAASGQAIKVNFATTDSTALASADYIAARGTLTFAAGQTRQALTVPIKGDLLDESDETFLVNLSGAINATLGTTQVKGTITDDDAPPTISIGDVKVIEGNTGTRVALFPLKLSAPSGLPIDVFVSTKNGTALSGSDYVALSTTKVTLKPGATSATIGVTIKGDNVFEGNETFSVLVSKAVNAKVVKGVGVGTITNDDKMPTLSVADVKVVEGNSGSHNAAFVFTLSSPSSQNVKVSYSTVNGTALAGSDYNAAQGTVTFAPGQTSNIVNVVVKGDTVRESDETFVVNLSGVAGATLVRAAAKGTIANDDK